MTIITTTSATMRRLAGRAGLALAATGISTVVGLGVFGPTVMPADATPSQSFGTGNLLQGNDIGSLKDDVGELNHQETELFGARGISACTGEASFDSLTGNKTLTSLSSTWSNSDHESEGLVTEAIAQAKTPAAAKTAANRVITALKACQREPKGHWHYGRLYHGPLRDGDHVWMDAIDGDGAVTGGVAVMLQGSRFGVVEVSSVPGDGDDAIKNTVLPAEGRLAG